MSNNPFGTSHFTNNPFALPANHPANRFPKLDDPSASVSSPQQQQNYGGGGYQPQVQPQPTGYFSQQQIQDPSQQFYGSYQGQVNPQPTGFQPTSAFGQQQQQLNAQQTGMYSPYGNGGGAYGNDSFARNQTANPNYAQVADLDPYSNLAQLPWAQPTRPADAPTPQSPTSQSFGGTSWNDDHPRSFVRSHKSELESWKSDAWKQFNASVEKLKEAWIGRKQLVIKAMEGYGSQWNPADAQRVRDVRRSRIITKKF